MFCNIRSDIKRFGEHQSLFRNIVRGILSQGFQAIIIYRLFHWFRKNKIPSQPFRFIFERYIEITAGISIPAECIIGKGFRIHHFGGIIFHPSVKMGEGCTIYHEVTIGDRGGKGSAAVIGNNVLIGAGAKIIGDIVIGDNCTIGANAVVNKNIPDNSTVVGNPSKIIKNARENN